MLARLAERMFGADECNPLVDPYLLFYSNYNR